MTARGHSRWATGPQRGTEQDRLQGIVERLADGVVILGLDGRIRFANPAAEHLFGRPVAKLTGENFGFPAVTGDGGEIDILRPGGQTVHVELRVVSTEWDGEQVRLVSLRDATDRKRAEDRMEQLQRERIARAEAEASSHAKSEFLATMSHELRTPLNAVIGYAEILDLGITGSLTAEQREQVGRIRNSARHLLGLVNEILDLAKAEAGRLSVQNRIAHAADACNVTIALVQPAAEARGIELSCRSASGDVVYDGDEDRVRQILINLLNNAVKFTSPGGSVVMEYASVPRPDPDVRMPSDAACVRISVIDTGVGIPADRIASIFDPFVQVERGHTRSKDGTGLGLTISRRLARLMGGDLTVHSAVGKGSTFTLWLRAASAAQREEAQWRAESPDTALRLHGLSDVGANLMREIPALVQAVVERLRVELSVYGIDALRPSQLADHVPTFIADVATTLAAIEDARGQPSRLVADGSEIRAQVAERHGAQRARLGWSVDVLRQEWVILREEVERAVRRTGAAVPEGGVAEALIILDRFLEQAEETSRRALTRATAPVADDSRQ